MRESLGKHAEKISGTISCFDRLIFKGYLPLTWPRAMEKLMARRGLLIKDFKSFVSSSSRELKDHAKAVAERSGRPEGGLRPQPKRREEEHRLRRLTQIALIPIQGTVLTKRLHSSDGSPKLIKSPTSLRQDLRLLRI